MECPVCRANRLRYALRTRAGGTRIAVVCDNCGHAGCEVPMRSMEDSQAALTAAHLFTSPGPAPVSTTLH